MVIGAGPIGLSTAQFALLAQAEVTVMDTNPRRLEFCQQTLNTPHSIWHRSDESTIAQLREITDGDLPSVVIDATGNAESMSGR